MLMSPVVWKIQTSARCGFAAADHGEQQDGENPDLALSTAIVWQD
jgi:hypothetical protein